jgi:hypothetical protein
VVSRHSDGFKVSAPLDPKGVDDDAALPFLRNRRDNDQRDNAERDPNQQ